MDATVTDIIKDVAEAVITVVAPIAVAKLWQLVGLKQNDTAQAAVTLALDRGAGVALDHGQEIGDALLQTEAGRSDALAKAVNYVATAVPGALKTLGVTPDDLATKAAAVVALKLHPVVAADVAATATTAAIGAAVVEAASGSGVAAKVTTNVLPMLKGIATDAAKEAVAAAKV